MLRNDPKTEALPIIMLTAKGEEVDKILGLEMGADDYITKPFSPRELVARVKAVLRRSMEKPAPEKILKVGELVIDRERYTLTIKGKPVKLSATEFKLLLFLAERKGKVFNREQLLDAVWSDEAFVEPRTVDVHIRRLRAQIEEDPAHPRYIKTLRGIGYFFDREVMKRVLLKRVFFLYFILASVLIVVLGEYLSSTIRNNYLSKLQEESDYTKPFDC